MKKSLRFIVLASITYGVLVYLTRGFLEESIPSSLTLLVIPLGVFAVILYRDLMIRAKSPSTPTIQAHSSRSLNHQVHQLTRQIEVTRRSSADYYDKVIIARLRQILAERASIETGIEVEQIRKYLADPQTARKLLRNDEMWHLLYIQRPRDGQDRKTMLIRLTDLIEEWKA